ncbi:MAG TPA: vitamin K epoxide reductase family protein [Nakamurella sp.]
MTGTAPGDTTDTEADTSEAGAATEVVATRTVAWVLLVAGLVGFVAAFVLAVEKYWLLTNRFYTPSCSVNAAISCGPVMTSPQAAVFGFPNPYLGIAGFAVVAATCAMVLAGGRLAGWYTAGLQVGAVLGTVFVAWLMVQSLTVIHALCPYCMAAWAATFATVWYVTLTNLGRVRHRLPDSLDRAVAVAGRNHSAILAGWLLIVAVLVTITAWQF